MPLESQNCKIELDFQLSGRNQFAQMDKAASLKEKFRDKWTDVDQIVIMLLIYVDFKVSS